GDDREIAKSSLSPAQKCIPLFVALKFEQCIYVKRVGCSELVDLHRVIDHKLRGSERIDFARIAAQRTHGVAHRGQIDHGRNTCEILHEDTAWRERYFL